MSALVSVTISEGGTLRRLFGASAYQHLYEQDAAKNAALAAPAERHRSARPRNAGPAPSGIRVLHTLAAAEGLVGRADIERMLDYTLTIDAINWHLLNIEKRGHAVSVVVKFGRKLFQITSAGRAALAEIGPYAGKGGRMAEVERYIRQHPNETSGQICAALGLNRQGLEGVLARLVDHFRVDVTPGRPRRYRVTDTEEAPQ